MNRPKNITDFVLKKFLNFFSKNKKIIKKKTINCERLEEKTKIKQGIINKIKNKYLLFKIFTNIKAAITTNNIAGAFKLKITQPRPIIRIILDKLKESSLSLCLFLKI